MLPACCPQPASLIGYARCDKVRAVTRPCSFLAGLPYAPIWNRYARGEARSTPTLEEWRPGHVRVAARDARRAPRLERCQRLLAPLPGRRRAAGRLRPGDVLVRSERPQPQHGAHP